jgi:hypothetical protein
MALVRRPARLEDAPEVHRLFAAYDVVEFGGLDMDLPDAGRHVDPEGVPPLGAPAAAVMTAATRHGLSRVWVVALGVVAAAAVDAA